MKKAISLLIIALTAMPIALFGQTYQALWAKVKEAEKKDLPQTQLSALRKIADKATRERAYGQLLKAELATMQVQVELSPDSLKPAVARMEEQTKEATDEVLRTVYQTVVYRMYRNNAVLLTDADAAGREVLVQSKRPVLTLELCQKLAGQKASGYEPFVVKGVDSQVFDHDLLSVIGMELLDYQPLHDYYRQSGNRRAACISGLWAVQQEDYDPQERLVHLDSLLSEYGDLAEVGEVAIARHQSMQQDPKLKPAEEYEFLRMAQQKWAGWKRIAILRDAEKQITHPMMELSIDHRVALPNQAQTVHLNQLRNLSQLSMKLYRVKANACDITDNPDTKVGYEKIKPLLSPLGETVVKRFGAHPEYELFTDSLTLQALPVGVYMLEFTSQPSTKVMRQLVYVTGLFVLCESQPEGCGTRYVVVDGTTGQPVAGANLRIRQYTAYNKYETTEATVDNRGEYIFLPKKSQMRCEVFAYTATDKACPEANFGRRYNYYEREDLVRQTNIYLDRSIYRPGQTVHVAALLYQVRHGKEHEVRANQAVTVTLRDANYKVIGERPVQTDAFGVCAADFTLPTTGLTGMFTVQVDNNTVSFSVEEYKRPTFQVEFPPVTADYKAGDTVRAEGKALTYAGVPVQGAKVSYRVVRRLPFWWWSYSRYWDTGLVLSGNDDEAIAEGEVTTGDDGSFSIDVPMSMPVASHPLFYNFVVTADVTDIAGETHQGVLTLPLGNRKTALAVDLDNQLLAESSPTALFHLRNAAGNDMTAKVRYRIDEGRWQTIATQQTLSLPRLKSGRHTLEATCEGDTLKRDFTVFSIDDKRPATETHDWFWQSADRFPSDGKPVTIQAGASDPDVHIVYSIFSGNTIVESGAVDKSNELINRKFTYKPEWGDGITLTFAWVKQGECHTHSARIERPMPDKRLRLAWTTFRDRLTPRQQEEWTLSIVDAEGQPVSAAHLMATMYDKSLDQLRPHEWSLHPWISLSLPSVNWTYAGRYQAYLSAHQSWRGSSVGSLLFSHFDDSVFPRHFYDLRFARKGHSRVYMAKSRSNAVAMEDSGVLYDVVEESAPMAMAAAAPQMSAKETLAVEEDAAETTGSDAGSAPVAEVSVRENLNETAFFYPSLMTDSLGHVSLRFTLPESLTTWQFMALAHTADLHYGDITAEAIAKKDVMIQPNMPRFVRQDDQATISARIFNTGDHDISGQVQLRLIDPETDREILRLQQPVSLDAGATGAVSFDIDCARFDAQQMSLMICQVSVSGQGFSDGEQHYLPLLPNTERITVSRPITQHEPGNLTIDLASLVPADAEPQKLTFEYTNNPAWLMIQALPSLSQPNEQNAVSLAAAYYANSIGRHIANQTPRLKTVIELWRNEQGEETSLMSALEKNQELKDVVLNETPWVIDADREAEQKRRLADFLDENLMNHRLSVALDKLQTLQQGDGSWPWWPGMPGSLHITLTVSEMLSRLNVMTGQQTDTRAMLSRALGYLDREMVEVVREMKREAKKGRQQTFPSFAALQYLYICALSEHRPSGEVQSAQDYLIALLRKDIKRQTIYEKALTAIILHQVDPRSGADYVKSLKEFTVYREEMGRYYDAPRASYSWFDYRIPTQTAAIEALQRITPADRHTIREMQRWLLQSKRTQAWDTPINSVDAIFAFMNDGQGNKQQTGATENSPLDLSASRATFTLDGKPLDTPKATAALGYVKTALPTDSRSLTITKTSDVTSWGAVYAQFTQPSASVAASGSGLKVTRQLLSPNTHHPTPITQHPSPITQHPTPNTLHVGDRIKVRLVIEADRDYDFVQVIDRRAAAMEPVNQLSGYHWGYYCAPRDNATCYYFDRLAKGRHIVETDYYIDRPGTYQTGTCTAECAYSPEFRAVAPSQSLTVE